MTELMTGEPDLCPAAVMCEPALDAGDADRLPLVVQEYLVRTILGTFPQVFIEQLRRS